MKDKTLDWKTVKTIKLDKKTHDRLSKLGKKGESFDSLINRVLDERED